MSALQALGWALVHSLWQDALAAAALTSFLAILPPRAAQTRYVLATATLLLMLALPLATALRLRDAPPPPLGRATAGVPTAVAPAAPANAPSGTVVSEPTATPYTAGESPAAPSLAGRIRTAIEPALPGIVFVWLGGVLALSLRLTSGWLGARRLGTTGTRPVPDSCRRALARLVARLRITRPVRIFESALVQVPAVIGWLRPVVLLPASALTGLTPLQLDALLAHELAHVRRHDYLVNVLQSVVETLLFYHPAVWWVSRRVREEREHCCDDLAVAVCGDAHFYATALLGMEQLRFGTPAFALAATGRSGSSLMARIRRLVAPTPTEIFPRWIAGVVAIALAFFGGAGLVNEAAAPEQIASAAAVDAARTAPDTVLRHPDPARSLEERWRWAEGQARDLGARAFWVGYSVRPSRTIVADPSAAADLAGARAEGRGFRGVPLGPLVGAPSDSDDTALLFRFVARVAHPGRPVLERVQPTSYSLPIDFGGTALLWLGPADDGASLTRLQALFNETEAGGTGAEDIKEDIVASVGLHGGTGVVGVLAGWLARGEPSSVRAQAAEWLGYHADPVAVRALARAARRDRIAQVRQEAADALGDNRNALATDSLIALARDLEDDGARAEAAKSLGHKRDPRALRTLLTIVRTDDDDDVQHEAVEALGKLPGGAGRVALADLARSEASTSVRREAVKTIAETASPDFALPLLAEVARQDRDADVQQEAVKGLGKVRDDRAYALLIEFARRHPVPEVRQEAVETLGEIDAPEAAAAVIESIAIDGSDEDLQHEAIDALGKLRRTASLERVARAARNVDIRREAIERYVETAAPETALTFLTDRLANDPSPDVQREALHRLAKLPGGLGVLALVEAARTHPNRDLRVEAQRRLESVNR